MNSRRLQPLQQLAEYREDQAVQDLLSAQRVLAERKLRLDELTRYREEYERQTSTASPQLIRNRHAFVDKLREAEQYQIQMVEQAQRGVEGGQADWLSQRRQTATLVQLADCYRRREQIVAGRREQQDFDELALRRHGRDSEIS